MRCPKCHYISFDSSGRCRNCGYEFSLSVESEAVDLPIQTGDEALGPLVDLTLTEPGAARRSAASAPEPQTVGRSIGGSFDLPLFKDRPVEDDRPLVSSPAAPRAPLAVRRSTPVIPRGGSREALEEPELDLEPPEVASPPPPAVHVVRDIPARAAQPPTGSAPAGTALRIVAAVVDGTILGSISVVVLYFTLKVCGLQFGQLSVLPAAPFTAFLMLVGGGYFVLFTAAGGQTIGKMLTGIKVVPVEAEGAWSDRVPLGHAVLRAAGYLVSVLPAGLGLLPALFAPDRRAVHDRLADTRVVKA
jgi:uncharacterized RDD family membrane protein YckC